MLRRRDDFPGQHLIVLPEPLIGLAERHPLLRGLFPTAAGYFPEAPGHFVERPAGGADMILIACISGRGWFEMGGRRLPVKGGEAIAIPPGAAHLYGADDGVPWSVLWAHFRGEDVPHLVELLNLAKAGPLLQLPPSALEQLRFEALYRELEAGSDLSNLLAGSARLRLILAELIKLRLPIPDPVYSADEALFHNIDWMRIHRRRRVTLGELAQQAGFSVPHYSAFFKRRTGMSPMRYFRRLKLQHASRLLARTDLRIEEVALAVGIQDPFYFSRLFTKVLGQSPRRFRAIRRKISSSPLPRFAADGSFGDSL